MKNIIEHLRNIAQVSFDFNYRAGRRGKEWAIDKEITFKAAKRIEELEKALAPFAIYGDIGCRGARSDELVVGIHGRDGRGEYAGIDLQARHFKKAVTAMKKA